MKWSRPIVAAAWLAACSSELELTLPPEVGTNKASVVYAFEYDDEALEVFAAQLTDDAIRATASPGVRRVRMLLFEADITVRFSDKGKLTDTTPSGVRVPTPDVGLTWDLESDADPPEWQFTMEPSGPLAVFRTTRGAGCDAFTVETVDLPVPGASIGDADWCRDACEIAIHTKDGFAYESTEDAPLEFSDPRPLEVPPDAGEVVLITWTALADYSGYERGIVREGGGGPEWIPGPWTGRALDYSMIDDTNGATIVAITDDGEIYVAQQSIWTRAFTFASRNEAAGWLTIQPPDAVFAYREGGFAAGSFGAINEHDLPTSGRVSSHRIVDIDGLRTDVLGTTSGDVLIQTGPTTWSTVASITAPVLAAARWRGGWMVFDTSGGMHQFTADGERCPQIRAHDEPAMWLVQTRLGFYVLGESTISQLNVVD